MCIFDVKILRLAFTSVVGAPHTKWSIKCRLH